MGINSRGRVFARPAVGMCTADLASVGSREEVTMQGVIQEAAAEPQSAKENQESSGERRDHREPSKRQSPDRGDIR